MRPALLATLVVLALVVACAPRPEREPPRPLPTPLPRGTPPPPPTLTPGSRGPVGFPVDESIRPWRVVERAGRKSLAAPAPDGPTVVDVVLRFQTRSENDLTANQFGWNCRLHARYEDGLPALDWYLPEGTPVRATMDGTAELYVITPVNSFEHYGVDQSLYLGLPDPALPLYPFPGPSGGMGVFVSVTDGVVRADVGHLQLEGTLRRVPDAAFVAPFTRDADYWRIFPRPRGPRDGRLVARWPVRRGDIIGVVGNTGYSDVPHLHYQVASLDWTQKYCPGPEAGFRFGGWLFAVPDGFPGYR